MVVKIGARIKALRKGANKTQEQLAAALGVTNQAISKWEGGLGYPDVGYLIPLANYFGVTLDDLFDRSTSENEAKKAAIIDAHTECIIYKKPARERIALMRDALVQFPDNSTFLSMLAEGLYTLFNEQGAPQKLDDYTMHWDYEAHRGFEGGAEAIALYEKILANPDAWADDHALAKSRLVHLYSRMGEAGKALEIAKGIPGMISCQEKLLAEATDGDNRLLFKQTYAFRLLELFTQPFLQLVVDRKDPKSAARAYEIILEMWQFVFSDGNFGCYDKSELYENYAHELVHLQRHDDAVAALKNAFAHAKMHDDALIQLRQFSPGEKYRFTAPLVNRVEITPFPAAADDAPITMYVVPTGAPDKAQRLQDRLNTDMNELRRALCNHAGFVGLMQSLAF